MGGPRPSHHGGASNPIRGQDVPVHPHPGRRLGQATTLDGAEVSESCTPYLRANPAQRYARLYENYLDTRWEPGAIQEFKARVVDSLDVGYNISVHVGHGFRNVMSCGDLNLTNADAAGLTNGNRLTNLYAANCTSNAIDYPCLGESFLHASAGGAVTSIGSTRVDFPAVGRYYQAEYFRLVFQDSVTAVGEAQGRQKLPFVAFSDYENAYRWTDMTLILLGDPELRLWTGRPRTLTVTHPSSVVLSATSLTVNVKIGGVPLYGARVTAYKPDDEYRTATTDGAGNAVLDFRPDGTGSFYLTVTAYDCRPYQAVVPVTAASQAVLVEQPYTLDDDNSGGTHGNNNQVPEAGETVDLRIPIRNAGGATATGVTATLTTIDPMVTVVASTNTYGSVPAGGVSNGTSWFRFATPYTLADQREIPFALGLKDLEGQTFAETLRITLRAPELSSFSHSVTEVTGNGNGRPEPGETVDESVTLKNLGTGAATGVTAILRCTNGLATVTDSMAVYGPLASGNEVVGDPFRFSVGGAAARFELRVSTADGLLSTQPLDLGYPATPAGLAAQGASGSIALSWSPAPESDLVGYNIYRGPAGGALVKVNVVPTARTSYFRDIGLAALTQYDYAVSAVDSSGNESARTATIRASTNPPSHAVFPIAMGGNTPGSVAVAHLYAQPGGMEIVAGADVLYCWHSDGTSPVDADGSSVTSGDFTTLGSYYAAGPTIADLDGGGPEIMATTWDSQSVYVFDLQGNLKPGWPFAAGYPMWSAVAAGDLGNDGHREVVFGSNGPYVFALKPDGTQWIDGDANPATNGVFKNIGSTYNYGTPALADLDGNGQLDIIYAGSNGILYAWRPDGTNLPGFPVTIGGTINASVAIGYLDGAADTQLEIVVPSAVKDSLYVFKRDGGRRAGFPVYLPSAGSSKQPSPALADIDRNGTLDIVAAGTDGKLYVFDRNGVLNPNFTNVRYSALTSQASESSPVVADIDGDGAPDIVIGDENGVLSAFAPTGLMLRGFPIQLGGEVRGTPALCDCDGDGLTEIVEADWDTRLYVWDYDFPFSPAGPPPWPQFHHDAMRTGLASTSTLIAVPDEGPTAARLFAPRPNPAYRRARVDYGVGAGEAGQALEIAVFDLGGRKLRVLASERAAPGRATAVWDLRDAAGLKVPAGVYFVHLTLGHRTETQRFVVLR
ncbi:MAG: hypothetical protein E6K78_06350 [Candidatus Eisenbacteria bacterium]|uniref:Fibronectin type-III domain-containing protein n=1 Tax=Eiseniibacteriota bacterium TaxID=2212470 RepID=A0A538TS81_UNCEI|nr:MAG: hypothetical protein E6K78_06350 [Candidatus Eisenbacteria bacterium]